MRPTIRAGATLAAVTAAATAVAGLAPATAAPQAPAPSSAKVLVDGLNSAKGFTVVDGRVVVAQGSMGSPAEPGSLGRVLRVNPRSGKAEPVGKKAAISAIEHTDVEGGGWWTLRNNAKGVASLYFQKTLKTKPKLVKNLPRFVKKNPDPYDLENRATESNPFGLGVDADGDALVADAAANAVYEVKRGGKARVLARFRTEVVSTSHIPAGPDPEEQLPPSMPTESVPTDVAVAKDGTVYVSELKGFPFRPGSSRIYAIKAKAKGKPAICAPTKKESRRCSTAVKGLNSVASFDLLPGGGFVGLGYAAGGVGEFEAVCFADPNGPPTCPPATLWKATKKGKVREVANPKGIKEPGTVRAISKKKAYVTDGLFTGGRLLRVTLK